MMECQLPLRRQHGLVRGRGGAAGARLDASGAWRLASFVSRCLAGSKHSWKEPSPSHPTTMKLQADFFCICSFHRAGAPGCRARTALFRPPVPVSALFTH
jgi:hypothetical protein